MKLLFSVLFLFPVFIQAQLAFQLGGIYEDAARDIVIDNAGNVYITGTFQGEVDFDTGPSENELSSAGDPTVSENTDIFIARYTDTGELIWAFAIGGAGQDVAYDLEVDAMGRLYLSGFLSGSVDVDPSSQEYLLETGTGADAFVASFDTNGNFRWARALGSPEIPPIDTENPRYEIGNDLDVDATGNVYLTGVFDGIVDFDRTNGSPFDSFVSTNDSSGNPSQDIFVVSYGPDGTYRWGFALGGPGEDRGQALVLDGMGNFALAGIFSDSCDLNPSGQQEMLYSNGKVDAFLAHYQTPNGVMNWALSFGGVEENVIMPGALAMSPAGNWITGGWFKGLMYADPNNATPSFSANGDKDMFAVSYSANGVYHWGWGMGGVGEDQALQFETDDEGGIFVAGSVMGMLDVDPGLGLVMKSTQSTGGASDIFMGKYDSQGQFLWANLLGGPVNDSLEKQKAYGLTVDTSGSVLVCGQFYGIGDFDPAADVVSFNSIGKADCFVAKYDPWGFLWAPTTAIDPELSQNLIKVWPNPFEMEINIDFSLPVHGPLNIEVFDLKGRLYLQEEFPQGIHSQSIKLALPVNLSPGIYLLKISTKKAIWMEKLMKY